MLLKKKVSDIHSERNTQAIIFTDLEGCFYHTGYRMEPEKLSGLQEYHMFIKTDNSPLKMKHVFLSLGEK